jgi:Fe2+ transport system protein B
MLSAIPAKEIVISNIHMLEIDKLWGLHQVTAIPQALSYLILIMSFFPCTATFGMVHREGNWRLLGRHLATAMSVSYVLSALVY